MAEHSTSEVTEDIGAQLTSSSLDSREILISNPTSRRFTVSGFKHIPKVFVPTLAIGVAVVILATVMLAVTISGR
jgi:hypothetical protein